MFEEEEEDEEGEEVNPLFSEDERVQFMGEKICQMLKVSTESWNKFVIMEENQTLLTAYFEARVKFLFFTSASSAVLTVSSEVSLSDCKRLYVLKKENVPILSENCRNILLFGVLSPSLLLQLSTSVDKVCLPLLSNKENHQLWPNVISQDVTRHIENLSNKVSVVKGQVCGKTVLPVPVVTERIEDCPEASISLQGCHDRRAVMHAVESMVINWAHLIQKVLKEDSAELILKGLNPGPSTELDFWRSRKNNIENIHEQLQSTAIQKMVRILEVADSSYYPSFRALTEEVYDALQEARDVDLHLQQLQPVLSYFEKEEFSSIHQFISPLFHVIFLVWTHCSFYRQPARIVVLLQELCNLLIQQANSYLSGEELLRGETEETLEKLQAVMKLIRCFKETFHTYREKVATWASSRGIRKCWDFPSALVFSRFDCFTARVLQLEDLFFTMVKLQKMEKVIFGGIKGRMYTEQVFLMHSEFQQLCKGIMDSEYDPLDLTSKDFDEDYTNFKENVTHYDRRLGNILCLAYKDCSGLESIFKLLAVFRPFMDRGIIKETFTPNFTKLMRLFGVELETCKYLLDSQREQRKNFKAIVGKNMPAMSGALTWAKMLRNRIENLWENFQFALDMTLEVADMTLLYHKYMEMSSLLDEYEKDVYSEWCSNVEQVCQLNLDQPLIKRDLISGFLSVNFNQELLAVLRDVRHLRMLDQTSIPCAALELYEKRDMFLTCVSSLQLLVQLYNKVRHMAVDAEVSLMKAELEVIDKQLYQAETDLTWQDQGCLNYICQVKDMVYKMERKLQKSKDNVEMIKELMKGWSKQPIFCRKDSKKDTLLMLEDRAARVAKKYSSIRKDGETIHSLLQENKNLYTADDDSEAWKEYVEYVDEMVVEGFFNAINYSLEFFVNNMEGSVRQAPLLEAQMVLSASEIVFRPSLDIGAGDGLYELVEGLLQDVFQMSTQIKRVAPHLDMKDYQVDMDDMLDLLDLRQEVMERVKDVIVRVSQYQSSFENYTHLWLDDRSEFLKQFLLYGQALTTEYVEAYGEAIDLPENPPTTDKFKEQIDHYEELYVQVSKLEDWRVFDGWFRVDIRSFKMSLLNTIKKWSWMFKEHLISYVTENITDLEEFILRVDSGLREPMKSGDYQALVQVMGCLLAVRSRQPSTDQMFDPLTAVVSLLQQYGETLPDHIYTQLEELPERWNSIKKLAWSVKHEVAPLQNAEVAVIRRKYGAFEIKLHQFEVKFRMEAPLYCNTESPYTQLDNWHSEMVRLEQEAAMLQESCKLFEVSSPDFRQLRLCQRQIFVLKQLWDLLLCAQSIIDVWKETHWREINVDQMDAELKRFAKEMQSLDKDARGWDVYVGLDHALKDLLTALRAVTQLQNSAMRERHWAQLATAMRVDFTVTEKTTLADLLTLQLHMYEEEVHNTVAKAVKEMAIEKALSEISQTWSLMEFTYEEHFRTSTPVLKCDDELIERLEDHQVQLQAMLQTKQVEFFHRQVLDLQGQLTQADTVLFVWLEVQRTWAYLESIFMGSDDIHHQLPEETQRFHTIDTDFKDLMFKSAETKNVIAATNKPHLLEILEDLQIRLAVCEKALAKYLEKKRIAFPRFYFISSADLLDILSKGNQPKEVTHHLAKLFDSIADLQFCQDEYRMKDLVAVGMFSREREYVPFHSQCDCVGPVELWLTNLEEAMREAVRMHIAEAVAQYEERLWEQWVLEHPAQVTLTASQIWWSTDVGLAFQRLVEGFDTALRDYSKKQIAQLNSLINMLLGELSPGDRQKIMTLCTVEVHARDVVFKLITQKVNSANSFAWLSQLRHYWDEEQKHCFANICDAQFLYSYEYLGNTPRLVITPLTDRCYVTLTQSLHLMMSGAPAGPAGTGKTETTKDLGKALGVMVYVFNCSEQMDYKSIGNIFKGLSQTGTWGCFDEFNRIAVEVLSVVAVQVKTIQDAIRHKRKRLFFLDEEMSLKPSVGIFITMNPDYAGRTELPENLKALFRPCAMVVPDLELICEIMLMAEGFLNARLLGRKFITLYNLCKELLSKQNHYDWGLRAIKSVLVVAGALKREDKARPEDQVLMRALRDFNMPKIITEDVPVFLGLVSDLFPGVEVQRRTDSDFEQLVRQSALELKLQPEDPFILKVVQLEELLSVRHSVFVVGNAGTGKSQILRTLYKTYINMQKKPVWNDLNPKAISRDELFGFIHPGTREWKDGLLSCLMREQANNSHPGPKWIILDGDVDPMWIESLNTVMDDNKVLTLASNERIPLTSSMRLVFEISHLRNATPATVSRAGILYVNPQDLSWNLYVTSWIDRRKHQTEKAHLTILFDKYVSRCIEQMRSSFKTIIPIPENSMVQTLCLLLDCLLTSENVPADSPREVYETYFVFACIWAFGGATYQDQLRDDRAEFSQWWTKEMRSIKLPAHGSVFDYYLDPQTRRFLPWTDKIPSFHMEPDKPLQAVLVPTAETVRLQYFMRLLLESAQPLMLVGGVGTGKTAMVKDLLATLPETFVSASVPLHHYSTSSSLQKMLERPLEKKAGRKYAPPGNKRLIYFVDDMNMTATDSYGTVQPHTLIRQHLDYKHWYDSQKLSLKEIHKTQYIACLNPQAGSYTINPRLQRHFSVLAVNNPTREALSSIYSSILSLHIQSLPFNMAVARSVPSVVQAAIALHDRVIHHFLPSANKFHHLFSQWDLSQLFQGLLLSRPECVRHGSDLVQLWVHESKRVYSDRMADTADLQLFHRLQTEVVQQVFEKQLVLQEPLIYLHSSKGAMEPCYSPVEGWEQLRSTLTAALDTYNQLHSTMNLVLFQEAMQHVCRISRILVCQRGHALLVGVGGSGKQSLTRLAAYLSDMNTFQPVLHKGYSIQDLKMDLAGLCVNTGVKNLPTVLLLTDAQIPDERFLIIISTLISSGEIRELLSDEEMDTVMKAVKREVRESGLLDTTDNCWKFFKDRVHQNLKVVLCMSPVGNTLRVRMRRFPALLSCTTVDWFHEWPQEALQSVSLQFIKELRGIEPAIQEPISLFMAHAHASVKQASKRYRQKERRHNYSTPKSFLELLRLFGALLERRDLQLQQRLSRLNSGLHKLKTTASQVGDLMAKLNSQEVELNMKNQAAEALITKIGQQTERVSQKRKDSDLEEQNVAAIKAEVTQRQRDCEDDLIKAEPALEAATAALDTLNKVNLTELKTFPNPPEAVTNVMAAVMVLLAPRGRVPKDRSWKAARAFMGKLDDFLQALVYYDKEHIPEQCLSTVKQEYLSNPDFHPDHVRTKSYAAAGLCAWTINIVRYYEVYCQIVPKRQALSQANTELDNATAKLLTIRKKLDDLDRHLQSLTAQFERAAAEKLHCQEEVTRTRQTIELASRLVGGLQSENVRWSEAALELEAQQKTLCGDVLVAAAFVSYAGYFTQPYRKQLLECTWKPFLRELKPLIPLTEGLDPILLLAEQASIAAWHNQGLPPDRLSVENAVILTCSQRWPLLVDPQQQASKWLRNLYGPGLRVLQHGEKGYLDVIEQALVCGEVVLLENVEERLDVVLEPLLARNTTNNGRFIRLGDRDCEYNSRFWLLLHTKLANPDFPPELQAQTTLINFTVTQAGLEEQLLGQVVSHERPDLETMKLELSTQQYLCQIELKKLEDELLSRLSAAEGSFLRDAALVEQLEQTKNTAAHIQNKVIEARENEMKINETRELYRPVAQRATLLYFIIKELHNINPMYQYSFKAFSAVFHKAIEQTPRDEDVAVRVHSLTEAVTYSVFMYTSQGLFQKDRLTFLTHTAFQILLMKGSIESEELDLLLHFPVEFSSGSPVSFLSAQAWGAIRALSVLEAFRGLDRDVEGSPKRWRKLVESECPERECLPLDWKKKNPLQRLIILRAMRPDRMSYALRNFVEESLGCRYVETTRIEFEKSYEESSPSIPVFFILSPGVNPLKDVETLGLKLGFSIDRGNLHNISLGQGQENVAEKALEMAATKGHWVILQNVHLVERWLGHLEGLLESTGRKAHPQYRVFMSGQPAHGPEEHIIPRGILENALKLTNEPPTGMNASLHAALHNFNQETLEMCSHEQEFKALLFSLCYFHACVSERRKFGPQGWNRCYPFNTGDLTISINVLYNYLEVNSKVPWEDLCYLVGEIMYGGHITDDWDRRLCRTYIQEVLNPKMFEGELFLCPGFSVPPNLDYAGYHSYVDESLPEENPSLYGLHPNAEIEFMTVTSNALFNTLLELQCRDFAGEEGAQSVEEKVKSVLDDILEKLPEKYSMSELLAKTSERSPLVLLCFQECERMNLLISEIHSSLTQLDLALKGELSISPDMETLQTALYYNRVPESWSRLTYPSTHTLAQWFSDVLSQCRELDTWTQDFVLPAVVWLSGLFSPQSFLTAIMQSIARKNKWPLDKMALSVDVTKKTKDDYGHPPREGAYIHGLYMEGARWDMSAGVLSEAVLKDLTPAMPVLYIRAVPADKLELNNTYECPVYRTKLRGPTFIWGFHLKTRHPPAKWVLAGVALLLSV
ncbi:dynein axonemal heavy chain 11 isoform X1 [Pangasianodon hypophthalmus]|uniref:dynein axonemal heavy chain 11 isoform X1 n=3 Tax=Pangasianodon hypophthalmus TaxID=310915 RepID=UPI0023073E29|nr:dynein axonemal heavy chain 11 isoform X1 [Pangasianodon hypophthalmus]